MKNKEIERESLLLEIQSRKEVLKKIENAYKRLKHQAEVNYEKRKAKIQTAREYKSVEEAHDAFGYDCITEKEYCDILEKMYHPSMVKLPNAAFYIVAKMPLRKKASYIKMLRTILLGYLIN